MAENRPIEGTNPLKPPIRYTYKDYLQWPEDERWELIEGIAYSMSPAPNRRHQGIHREIMGQLISYFKGKPCKLYPAPIDVFLPETDDSPDDISTIVQPDILVVCDPAKLKEVGILGAPDFIIEILSPATAFRDQSKKKLLYEKHGVKEYWIVNPETLEALIYRLKGDRYELPVAADLRHPTPVSLFPGLELSVQEEEI